jgi:hypothetical protein
MYTGPEFINCRVGEIPDFLQLSAKRAGIVLVSFDLNTDKQPRRYIGLGIDSRTCDLTDFGGKFCSIYDRHILDTALREFDEETLYMFNKLTYEDVKDSFCLYNKKIFVLFLNIIKVFPKFNRNSFNNSFIDRVKKATDVSKIYNTLPPEITGIIWVETSDLSNLLKSNQMFPLLKNFLLDATTQYGYNLRIL